MNTQKAAGSLLVMENALKGLTKAAGVLVLDEVAEMLKQVAAVKRKLGIDQPVVVKLVETPVSQSKMEQTLAKMREYQERGTVESGGGDGVPATDK